MFIQCFLGVRCYLLCHIILKSNPRIPTIHMKKQRGGGFLETCPLSPASKWQDCCWSLGRTPKPLSLPSPPGMPVSQEKRRKQTSLRCPFSPGQRQGQLSLSGQRAIPRQPPPPQIQEGV